MALSVYLEAEYSDGFVVREDEADQSAYEPGRNVFYDILHRLPEARHGAMTRLALVCPDKTYTVDWTQLPANARPVRFKHMERDLLPSGEWVGPARMVRIDFGFQYRDDNGRNVKDVKEIHLSLKQ